MKYIPLPVQYQDSVLLKDAVQKLAHRQYISSQDVPKIDISLNHSDLRLKAHRIGSQHPTLNDGFRSVLTTLWINVVELVVRALQLPKVCVFSTLHVSLIYQCMSHERQIHQAGYGGTPLAHLCSSQFMLLGYILMIKAVVTAYLIMPSLPIVHPLKISLYHLQTWMKTSNSLSSLSQNAHNQDQPTSQ